MFLTRVGPVLPVSAPASPASVPASPASAPTVAPLPASAPAAVVSIAWPTLPRHFVGSVGSVGSVADDGAPHTCPLRFWRLVTAGGGG